MTADALATTFMVVGSERVPAIAAEFPGVDYMLILSDGDGSYKTVMNEGFRKRVAK